MEMEMEMEIEMEIEIEIEMEMEMEIEMVQGPPGCSGEARRPLPGPLPDADIASYHPRRK